jgi:hypothetical protein
MTYTSHDILTQLDKCAEEFVFPMLDNGYIALADVRLSAYRDPVRWALIIEVLGFSVRGGAHNGISNCLHVYGNCLKRPPGTANGDSLYSTADAPPIPVFCDDGEEVEREATTISIRGRVVPIDLSAQTLIEEHVHLMYPPRVTGADLLRSLLPAYRNILLATEDELQNRVPPDLPLFLRLDEWHHPDLVNNERPSASSAFVQIAKAIETGDRSHYSPSEPPNTHWKNWPEGGTL